MFPKMFFCFFTRNAWEGKRKEHYNNIGRWPIYRTKSTQLLSLEIAGHTTRVPVVKMDEATETATTTTAHTTLINLSRSDEEDEAEGIQNLNAAGFEEASHSTTTTTVLPPYSQPAPPQQHQTIKRRKVRNGKTPPGGGGGRGSMDGEKLRRKRLLVEAAKFSNSSAQQEAEHRRGHTPGDDDHVDPLASFVRLATSMGAPELFKV